MLLSLFMLIRNTEVPLEKYWLIFNSFQEDGGVNMNKVYLDEKILDKRKEILKITYKSLEDGFYIHDKMVYFERKDMNLFSIMIPTSFIDMPIDLLNIKYPSKFGPQKVLTSADLIVNMGFSITPDNVLGQNIEEMIELVRGTLRKERSGLNFSKREKFEKVQGWWFSFRSHGMDNDLFNMLAIISIEGRVFQLIFNCPYKNYEEWKIPALQMWESIESVT
jgi:hypothetical protein